MEKVFNSDYSEISYSHMSNTVLVKWKAASINMSEWEFNEQLDTLFSTAEVFKAKIFYMDAFDLSFLTDCKSVGLINNYLERCEVKIFGIVMSSNLKGKLTLHRFLKMIKPNNYHLTIFKTRNEGKFWYTLKSGDENF